MPLSADLWRQSWLRGVVMAMGGSVELPGSGWATGGALVDTGDGGLKPPRVRWRGGRGGETEAAYSLQFLSLNVGTTRDAYASCLYSRSNGIK